MITYRRNYERNYQKYDSFDLYDNGKLTFVRKNEVIGLGNISEGLHSALKMIKKLGVNRLKLTGFTNIMDGDIHPYRARYNDAREMVRKLGNHLNERSKAIKFSSTTNAEAFELIEITSEDIDTTVKDVEQGMSFIEADERDKLLLPLQNLNAFKMYLER